MTTMPAKEELDLLEALLEKALKVQPGPFRMSPWHVEEGESAVKDATNCYLCTTSSDVQAECIAELLNHGPALIQAARRVERLEEALRWYVENDAQEFSYLDRGIGTATPKGIARLAARNVLKEST